MIRKYDFHDCINNTPRIMISMNTFGDGFETGRNGHYSIDSNITECLIDFFQTMLVDTPKSKPTIGRSNLKIEYLDLPTTKKGL